MEKANPIGSLLANNRQIAFAFTWALAMLVDEARQPESFDTAGIEPYLSLLVYIIAAALMIRPGSTPILMALSVVNVVQLGFAFPHTTNHGTILGFANLVIFVHLLVTSVKSKSLSRGQLFGAFPILRLAFLIMYGSAAIAKLNSTFFFELEVSCATTLADEELAWLPIQFDYTSMAFLPWAVAATELCVFLLPMFSRTRYLGIVLAIVFHTALSLNPFSKGPGFTLILFALLGLFMSDGAVNKGLEMLRNFKAWLGRYIDSWFTNFVWYGFLAIQAYISYILAWQGFGTWRWLGTLLLDFAWSAIFIYLVVKFRNERLSQPLVTLKPLYGSAVVALVLFNSAWPYLGGKTASSMTMYSNLQVEGGKSNHFLIPRLPVSTSQDEIVTPIRTNSPGLQRVIDEGWKITMHEFIRQLAQNPEQPIEYEYNGERILLRHASDRPELVAYDPIWHKLIGHRKITNKCVW